MRRYWTCPCGTRSERAGGRKTCPNCGRAAPKMRKPAHMKALEMTFDQYAVLQEQVHGLDETTCAICLQPGREDLRLQRDHAHFDGGYPRGLVHALCNKRLGEVERGQDGEAWMESALAYVRRARAHHEGQQAA